MRCAKERREAEMVPGLWAGFGRGYVHAQKGKRVKPCWAEPGIRAAGGATDYAWCG